MARPPKQPSAEVRKQIGNGRDPKDGLRRTKKGRKAAAHVENVRIKALKESKPSHTTLKAIEQRKANKNLTERQLLFVRFWAAGETPRTAAVMAGYTDNYVTGWKLSKDPTILRLYHEEKKLYEAAGQMTRERVMEMLKEAYDMAKLKAEPAIMVAAAREIGKMCGYYEPELKININIGKSQEQLATMTDEQLLKLIEDGGDIFEGESIRVPDVPQLEAPQ